MGGLFQEKDRLLLPDLEWAVEYIHRGKAHHRQLPDDAQGILSDYRHLIQVSFPGPPVAVTEYQDILFSRPEIQPV